MQSSKLQKRKGELKMDRDYGKYKLKELKKGELFTLKDYGEFPDEARVYVKGEYDRSAKDYTCWKFEDVNEDRYYKGTKEVYAGFIF